MGQNDRHGFLKIKRESDAGFEYVTELTVSDDALFDGAGGIDLTNIAGTPWVEVAASAFVADLDTAVTSLGATPATLVVDESQTLITSVVIPATLFLRFAKGAVITKSGSGSIEFEGMGLDDPMSQTAVFVGFDAGDVFWSGTDYPRQISIELWDTANDSIQDRYNRADMALVGKYAHIYSYVDRTITTATAIVGEQHHLFMAGEYDNTCATYGASNWPPFLMKNNSSIIGLPGNRIHESSVDGNGWIIYAWHAQSGGGESTGYQESLIVEGLNIIGDPTMVDISGGTNSCIILGNCHDSAVRNCRFYFIKSYAVILGLYGTDGNYAYRSEIYNNVFISCGTQLAVLLNAKGCRIANNRFYQQDSSGTSSYTVIDVEPNTAEDVIEDCIIENNTIDARDVPDGAKFVGGIAIQAALSGSMKNITIRHNKVYGADIYPLPSTSNPLTSGIYVYGAQELYIHDNEIRGAFQRAYQIERNRYVRCYDNQATQCTDVNAELVAMDIVACADSDFYDNVFNRTPAAFTQSTGIREIETEHPVTTSGSTITNIFDVGIFRLWFDLYVGLTVTINATDYLISGFTSHTIMTSSTSVGTLAKKTFVDANVTTGSENIAVTAHGHNTGSTVRLTSTGTVPAGLTANRTYYVIRVDADNLKLADTLALAIAGTPVNVTAAAGGGTHTLTPILTTKFSNNEYWGNKTPDGISVQPGSTVHNEHDTNPQDYVAADNSIALTALASSPLDTILGTVTEVQIDPVTWDNMVGVTQSGADNKLTKPGGGSWNAGAFSVESIPEGGYLEWTCTETTTHRMIGLSFADSNQHYNTINYAVYLTASANMQCYELGTPSGSTPSYVANTTVIRMSRVGTTIEVSVDGAAPFHTFTSVPSGDLHVDCSIDTTGGTVGGVILGGIGNVETLLPADVRTVLGLGTQALVDEVANVADLSLTVSATYDPLEAQAVADKLDELLAAMIAAGHMS